MNIRKHMKIAFTLILFFMYSNSFSQQIYKKGATESNDSFMSRVFPQYKFSEISDGEWGDTTTRNKLIGFNVDSIAETSNAIILQEVAKDKFQQLDFDYSFAMPNPGTAWGTSGIGIFYYDINNDGNLELIILESAVGRCYVDIDEEEEDENGKTIIVWKKTWILCDKCGYYVFEQKNKSISVTLIKDESFDILEYNQSCSEEYIKGLLEK